MRRYWMSWIFAAALGSLAAQTVAVERLTVDQIMEGEDFVGVSPSQVRWDGAGEKLYFRWREPGETGEQSTYVIGRDGTGLQKLTEEEAEQSAWPRGGEWDRERRRLLFEQEGDLWLLERDGARRKLVQTQQPESDPHFSADERAVFFTAGDNLFRLPLDEGRLQQITDFRKGSKPEEKEKKGSEKFLQEQQEQLFEEFSGDKKEQREKAKKRREERDARAVWFGEKESVSDLRISPDEKYVTFEVNEPAAEARRTVVPDYVTEDGYVKDLPARDKVGDDRAKTRLGVYEVESGKVSWVEAAEGAAGIIGPRFSRDSGRAVVGTVSSGYEKRTLLELDPATGETRELDVLEDEAWIGGPAAFTFGWMPGGEAVYFVSEKTGYAHLYVVDREEGAQAQPLTGGEWEVHSVELSHDEQSFYLTTSEVHPGERHFYRLSLDGGEKVRLTSMEGANDVELSPDERFLAIRHSYSNRPPELYVQENRPDAEARRLTTSMTEEFRAYPWRVPELVRIPARDGARPWARFYRPEQPAPGRPAVIFVHGAGYLQNAHKRWSSYYREYMFHHLLAEHGYHVLDIDYRGSAGYGRDWRTAIYRHMGGKDLTDQVDGARWLIEQHGVDPARIGIYGGSYGGFITLMAMFTEADVFAAGASLRPVTDWAHYNHWYTSRILEQPQDDAEAYERSSPIYFAEGLKGALLICHGMIDVNVHFQDTVRLAQRLIELRKENWEVAIYPVEGHGFRNATSWADEYKRIFRLFEQNLK